MKTRFKATAVVISLVVLLAPVSWAAEQSKQAPPAPIPAPIFAAKKIFVANAGGEEPLADDAQFSGDSTRAYNQFYAAMKTWGRYELVNAPADADLWFEIRFTVPPAVREVMQGNTVGTAEFDPQLRLVIRDSKSGAVLWGFTEHAGWAVLKGNRDKNFDQALAKIVGDVQRLAQQATDGSTK